MTHGKAYTILHIDDTEATRYATSRVLKSHAFRVLEAGTGKDGLRQATESTPDLIILDIHLPDMLGFEVCRILKANPTTARIPVLQISASFVTSKDKVMGLEGGADSYLTHPVEPGVLIATVHALLRLRIALDEAERANGAKSQFLANISHEIRTPLGIILGAIELLRDQRSEDRDAAVTKENLFTMIERNAHQLSGLIGNVLDLSKVEAGSLEIEKFPFRLDELVNGVIGDVRMKAHGKPLVITLVWPDAGPPLVVADPGRLRQILLNLMGNSVKFTAEGEICLEVKIQELAESGKIRLEFLVTDTGIGMDAASVLKLFEPFSQADQSITRRFGGTGLGLALSKKLAQALGGDLTIVNCELGKGSTFSVTILAEVPASKDAPILLNVLASDKVDLSGIKVLLIDDSIDNRSVISRFLVLAGAEVQTAEDGNVGIAKAESDRYDIVLMDLQMPMKDGFATTRELRNRGFTAPIVALTAHALKGDRDRVVSAGFNDYITKPVDRKMLIEAIKRLVRAPNVRSHHLVPEEQRQ